MSEEHVIDQLPAYALGGLEPDEQRQVERHVQGCQQCRSELRAYLETTAALSAAVPLVAPPDRVKTALLERVGGATEARPKQGRGGGIRAWLANTAPAWALAA
ncbi:MAG TPA: zf-HC2 domain-containing protein, partial [Anaerolineaceae bacterium]|nr:zf-HC2 domain-containing protein [Anaerolineaceae bacterium]